MKKMVSVRWPIEDGFFAPGRGGLSVSLFNEDNETDVFPSEFSLAKGPISGDDEDVTVEIGPLSPGFNFSMFGNEDEDGDDDYVAQPQVNQAAVVTPTQRSFDVNATPERKKSIQVQDFTPQRPVNSVLSPNAIVVKTIEGGDGQISLIEDEGERLAKKTGAEVSFEYATLADVMSPYVVKAGKLDGVVEDHMVMAAAHNDLDRYLGRVSTFLNGDADPQLKVFFLLKMTGMILDGIKSVHNTHNKVICDIKPMNVLVFNRGTLAVSDLGSLRTPGTSIKDGYTPSYAPPEFFPEGIKDNVDMAGMKVGFYSDVWSFGAMMYKAVFGEMYFRDIAEVRDINEPSQFESVFTPANMQNLHSQIAVKVAHLPEILRPHVDVFVKDCLTVSPDARPKISDMQERVSTALAEFNDPELLAQCKAVWSQFTEALS